MRKDGLETVTRSRHGKGKINRKTAQNLAYKLMQILGPIRIRIYSQMSDFIKVYKEQNTEVRHDRSRHDI